MNALLLVTLTCAIAAGDGDVIKLKPSGGLHKPELFLDDAPAPGVKAAIAVTPNDVAWKPGPPSLPAGTQAAVLEGDPTKPGIVTMRLKIPKGFRLAMHTHPADERVTVLSGTMHVTYIEGATTSTRSFPAGSFYVTPKGVQHSVAVDEETIIQITVQGPWGVAYVDAKDDPRTKK